MAEFVETIAPGQVASIGDIVKYESVEYGPDTSPSAGAVNNHLFKGDRPQTWGSYKGIVSNDRRGVLRTS